MRFLFIVIVSIALFSGCHSSKPVDMAALDTPLNAKDTAWISLFNGKTTQGWHTYGKTTAGKAWKAQDGILHLDASAKSDWQTKNGGDLVTDEEFENFELSIDWKISRAGNSGIIFYVNEDPKKYQYCWYTGIETQIADNRENEDGQIIRHRAGDLYDLMSISKEVVKPAGQWNKTVIIASNGVLNLFVNDEQVLTTQLWDDNWKRMVMASKFKAYPDFGTFKKGKIALQDHGADVWFKNIKIKRL